MSIHHHDLTLAFRDVKTFPLGPEHLRESATLQQRLYSCAMTHLDWPKSQASVLAARGLPAI